MFCVFLESKIVANDIKGLKTLMPSWAMRALKISSSTSIEPQVNGGTTTAFLTYYVLCSKVPCNTRRTIDNIQEQLVAPRLVLHISQHG